PKQLKVLQYDASAEVHAEAVRALPVLGREALPLLGKEARTGGPEIERAAIETLTVHATKLGIGQGAQTLEAAGAGTRPTTRRAAIEALGHLAENRSSQVVGVLGRLGRDPAADVRAEAAAALGIVIEHGVKDAIFPLKAAARDTDPNVRRRAAGAL